MNYADPKSMHTRPANALNLENILQHSREGVFVIDRTRRLVAFSAGCERLTGYPAPEVIGQACTCYETTQCEDQFGRSLSGSLCPGMQVFDHGKAPGSQLMKLKHREGREVWVSATYTPLHDPAGQVIGVMGILRPAKAPAADGNATKIIQSASAERAGVLPETALGMPPTTDDDNRLDGVLHEVERREIITALRQASGQRARAARSLGISRSRLYRRMEALGIDPRSDI